MTLTQVSGDLLDPAWGFDAIGHGVNLHGIMGAGIAKTISARWPGVMGPYRTACRNGGLELGGWQHYKDPSGAVVYNLASQDQPGRNARLSAVRTSVEGAVTDCENRGYETLGLPQIGCGIGGLEWNDVRDVLVEIADRHIFCDLVVVIYEPARQARQGTQGTQGR